MLDYAQLSALAAILRLGSFEAAAAELGVTQSAVSQRLRTLEDRIGQPLVLRGQPCTGTEAGRRLARHAEEVGLMETALADTIGGLPGGGRRPLRIAVNADSLAGWLVPALAAAQQAMPDLLFDIVVDDQDHSGDWLRRGEVSAAVTAQAAPPHGCNSHALGALRYQATASPAYLSRHFPEGVTADALRRAPMMTYDGKDGLQMAWLRREIGEGPRPPSHYLPSTQGFIDAARAGLAWGMNPEVLIRDALARGDLVPLIPDRPLDTPLFWQVSRLVAPAIAPVTRAVRATARDLLEPVVLS